jgi:hypothetical protein
MLLNQLLYIKTIITFLINFKINQILNLNWKIGKFYYMDFPIHSILCVFLRRPRFYLETLFRNFQVIDTIR